ncbi:MAG: dephospho-CoA kinase [Enterobacterales bacterium]|nr:dephospho-CoA kinase [Enterobacterales bacterium]
MNQLTHPLIFKQIKQNTQEITSPYAVIDIPLLVDREGNISSHYRQLIDRILVVEAPPKLQIKRLVQRNGLSPDEAKLRLKAQASNEQRRRLADDLLVNDQSILHLNQCLHDLHNRYLDLANKV